MKLHLTDDVLKTLAIPEGADRLVVWDTKQAGFGVVVMTTRTTFVVNRRVGPSLHRETIGHWVGRGGDLDARTARKRAVVMLGKLEAKEPTPNRLKRARSVGPTLAEAVQLYIDHLTATGSRPSSIATVRREMLDRKTEDTAGSYVLAWLDRPLASITGKECRARHEQITADNGPHVANRVLRQLRAVWNYIAKEVAAGTVAGMPEGSVFPANPTIAVVWNAEGAAKGESYVERRREPIPWSKLPAWFTAVQGLKSGVRRDYNMVVLLTGLRRRDAASLRWEHVNLSDKPIEARVWNASKGKHEVKTIAPRSMLRPSPKGGAARAFTVPLSEQLVEILKRRRGENQAVGRDDGGWVFPSRALKSDTEQAGCYVCRDLGLPPHVKGAVVHISEPKEDSEILVGPHRLRDTYTTALAELTPALSPYTIDVLTNHAPPRGSVTAGYIGVDPEALREPQERVSNYIMARTKPPTDDAAPKGKTKSKSKAKGKPARPKLTLVA